MEVKEIASAYLAPSNSGPLSVPLGYRKTEAGVIPEEWAVFSLGGILTKRQLGGNYRNSERETQWPLIKMGNLGRGKISLDKIEFVDTSQPPATCDRLEVDDVLFNTRNTVELVGKVAIWRGELPEAYFNSNIMRMEFDESCVSSKRFMNFMLNTPNSIGALRAIAIGTTSVAAIYSRDLVNLPVAVPPKPEQEAIAEALSDADALIESLEQLIAKKRQIKQGTMQALLTGKQRLPRFREPWRQMSLGALGAFLKGRGVARGQAASGDLACVRYGEIYTKHNDFIKEFNSWISEEVASTATRLVQGDLLFAGSGETKEEIGKCVAFVGSEDAYAGGDIVILRSSGNDPKFLGYYLNTAAICARKASRGQGDAVVHISAEALGSMEIEIPELEEQAAIATILSDMDTELAELEARLAKTRQLKQGMMQELLTGRIRLV